MRVLYITHNTSLRSTTCVLDAAVTQLEPKGLCPVFVFPEIGPWHEHLVRSGIACYTHGFITPDINKPIQFIVELFYWCRLLMKESIQLIHCNEHENYLMIRIAAKLLNTPVVVGVRFVMDKGFSEWAFGGRYAPAKLMFTSQDQLTRCENGLPDSIETAKIELLGNGRDLVALTSKNDKREEVRRSWGAGAETIVIGTASVIRRRKLLQDFIDIVGELVEEGYPVLGVIAGGGKYADPVYFKELEMLIVKRGLSEHVKMLGNLEEVAHFYQGLDIFVSTSELETFGMSVCEAMAFSLPVVAYVGGSVGEVLGDPRCVVDVGEKVQLLDKLRCVVKDKDYAVTLANRNRERAFTHFDAKVLAKRIEGIYTSVCGPLADNENT